MEVAVKGMVPPPGKAPRLENNTGVRSSSVSVPLVLGLGFDGDSSSAVCAGAYSKRTPAVGFTFMQIMELERQALIYKYLVAGVPVPVQLVLPIWKSLASSSVGVHHFPSLIGLGRLCDDYNSSMEPEPGRCRRTDGKKWRCSHDVVPGHKYCDRHVHRGRRRSKNPVDQEARPVDGQLAANCGVTIAVIPTTAFSP